METNTLIQEEKLALDRLAQMPPKITDLFDRGVVFSITDQITKSHDLAPWQQTLLENEVVLVLLQFLHKNGLSERLQEALEIDEATADAVASEIQNELLYLVDPILEETHRTLEKYENEGMPTTETDEATHIPVHEDTSLTVPVSIDQEIPSEAPPPSETVTEATSKQVETLRTMQNDMEKIYGYGSFRDQFPHAEGEPAVEGTSQEDILGKQTLAKTPRYEEK